MDTLSDKQAVELKLEKIDQELDRDGVALSFSSELEEQYEDETGPARARMYVRMGLLSLAFFDSLIVLDYFCLPDVIGMAILLRLGLATGLIALSMWITSRNPPTVIRESLGVAIYLAQGVIVYVLVIASSNPLRENYHLGILAIMMFAVMTLRLRFRYSVFLATALVIVELMTVFSLPELAVESKGASVFISFTFVIFSLMALHSLEKLERQSWLRMVRDRLRAEAFEELSIIDPLSGLGNRRSLQQWAEKKCTDIKGQTISLLIVDIDHFKSYNDTFGHLAGDDCIRRVSGVLNAEARKTGDKVFRFGGEEFIVFLVGIDLPGASAVAERMRRAIAAKGIPHKTPSGLDHVTASFGVASSELGPEFDLDALIGEADHALYEAKQNGRNCVVPPVLALAEERRAAS